MSEETLPGRYPGYCSFCRRHHTEAGPLAEGPDQVYICYQCLVQCAVLIQQECERLGIPTPPPPQ